MDLGRWWQTKNVKVVYNPRFDQGQPGDVLVGVGSQATEDTFAVLNHKAERHAETGATYASLSEYLALLNEATWARWRGAFPLGVRSVKRIVIEDASPDTCMALLLFALRVSPDSSAEASALGAIQMQCAGKDNARLAAWLSYVSLWEQGRYVDGADKRASAACQMSILAHHLLSHDTVEGRPRDGAREALISCMTLLDAYIGQNECPIDARPPIGLREYEHSDAQFEFEYQQYLLALKYGIRTQLALPLAGSSRSIMVDALFVIDLEISGILKILARTDTENSWTKRGFALLGVYRPSMAGTGDDMTVSVDPRRGVSLEVLWNRLEQLEAERWDGRRPIENPRPGIAKYSDSAGKPLPGSPNQPWYDEQGRYTIIAAPKFARDGVLGSKLGWYEDVLPALWELYSPIAAALKAGNLEVGNVERVSGRQLRTVRWRRQGASAAARTPTLYRWLASMSTGPQPRHPGEFVAMDELEIISLPGGDVIVHPDGVTLFDDWTSIDLDVDGLKRLARTLASLARDYVEILDGNDLSDLINRESKILDLSSDTGFRTIAVMKEQALHFKSRLLELLGREAGVAPVRGDAAVRQGIEKAWGLPHARHQLWEILSRVDELLAQAQTLLQERRQFLSTAIISIAGMFFVIRDGIAVVENFVTMNRYEMAIPTFKQFGIAKADPAAFAELQRQAALASSFDHATLIAMVVVFGIGIALMVSRFFGSRRRSIESRS